jgi:hypothetical protein
MPDAVRRGAAAGMIPATMRLGEKDRYCAHRLAARSPGLRISFWIRQLRISAT